MALPGRSIPVRVEPIRTPQPEPRERPEPEPERLPDRAPAEPEKVPA